MKFSEMKYEKPDLEAMKFDLKSVTERLKSAGSYAEAREAFLDKENIGSGIDTMHTLASIRHSLNTDDEFYQEQEDFWNSASPELAEYENGWKRVLRDSAYREEFEKEFGSLLFKNIDIELRSFSTEIIEPSKEENALVTEYEKLLAKALVPFEGKEYTIPQMTAFKTDADDDRRLAAWKAEGQWYKDNTEKLDEIYDKLVHLRTGMGRTLGHGDYIPLGYDRMNRNCYTREDLEVFRENVVKYLVPVAADIYREQAKRLGKEYPMSFSDNALEFKSGNPRPAGDEAYIVKMGKKFYDELSPETSEFFNLMIDSELMDLDSRKGKQGGGYCTSISDYHVPFIFANFNGTQGDIEVVTHEAGHAFADYMNRDRIPASYRYPTMESCEVHSMSMEFFGEMYAEDFFGEDARKFLYSHLAGAITFIPYGTMVDHFQHLVYEKPDMTPAERDGEWKRLLGIYMPWVRLDGDIPFYAEGEGWKRQHHIYSLPFYYIDYCLAQTVALQFWSLIGEDRKAAFEKYMAYTRQGGTRTFTELLENAGLRTPFDSECMKDVCEKAGEFLRSFDMTGME